MFLSPSKQPADYFSFDAEYTIAVLDGSEETVLDLPMDQCGSRIIIKNWTTQEGDCEDK